MKLNNWVAVLVAGSVLATASPALAQATSRTLFPSEVTDLLEQNNPDKMYSKDNRNKFVLSINRYCNHINFIFPQNSPEDEKWLNEEKKGSLERKLKVFDSIQHYKDKIKWFTFECVNNSENFEKNTQKERVGKLIGLINSFSKITQADSIKIFQLIKISNDESGLFMSDDVMKTIIIAASAENNGCDTDAPWCLIAGK